MATHTHQHTHFSRCQVVVSWRKSKFSASKVARNDKYKRLLWPPSGVPSFRNRYIKLHIAIKSTMRPIFYVNYITRSRPRDICKSLSGMHEVKEIVYFDHKRRRWKRPSHDRAKVLRRRARILMSRACLARHAVWTSALHLLRETRNVLGIRLRPARDVLQCMRERYRKWIRIKSNRQLLTTINVDVEQVFTDNLLKG